MCFLSVDPDRLHFEYHNVLLLTLVSTLPFAIAAWLYATIHAAIDKQIPVRYHHIIVFTTGLIACLLAYSPLGWIVWLMD